MKTETIMLNALKGILEAFGLRGDKFVNALVTKDQLRALQAAQSAVSNAERKANKR